MNTTISFGLIVTCGGKRHAKADALNLLSYDINKFSADQRGILFRGFTTFGVSLTEKNSNRIK